MRRRAPFAFRLGLFAPFCSVARPFRYRVLMEVNDSGNAQLLQQAFVAWMPLAQSSVSGLSGSYLSGTNLILHSKADVERFMQSNPNGRQELLNEDPGYHG